MKIFLLLLLLPSISFANECHIETFQKIYIVNSKKPLISKDIIKKSDCDEKTVFKFVKTVSNSRGTINSKFLVKELGKSISVKPRKLQLISLASWLKERLDLNTSWFIREVKFLNKKNSITLNKSESLQSVCNNCSFPGEKSIKLIKSNHINNSNNASWASAKVMVRTKALVAKTTLGVQSGPLSPTLFNETFVYTTNPEKKFIKRKNLVFFKLNKPLSEGSSLNFNDLVPVNLVRVGNPVKVEFNQGNLSLHGSAIPLKSGKLGETIQLKNTQTKKVIIGKIIDFNKVKIEL